MKWTVVGEDFNSPFVRNEIWVSCLFNYPTFLNLPMPVIGIISTKDQIKYVADLATWKKTHEAIKAKALSNYSYVSDLIDRTNKWGEEMNKWTENEIYNKNLKSLSNQKLVFILKQFKKRQALGYTLGVTMPILDFQGFSFVEANLKSILSSKLSKGEFQKYYALFTQPTHNSFAQDQEEALLRLIAKFKNPSSSVLKKHAEKFGWVYYVYKGPAFTEKDFRGFIDDYVHKKINPKKKLAQMLNERKRIALEKQKALKQLKPNKFELAILNLAGKMVWAKPRRKDYQSKSYYHLEKLMREIASRLFISLEQARSLPIGYLEKALKKNHIEAAVPNSIFNLHVCLPNLKNKTVKVLQGQQAVNFAVQFKDYKKASKNNIKEIKGTIAYAGKATGRVKIINTSADMSKMEYNDVLVSIATTPAVVPAMKKAAAIVTEEGGLTCHAAIVSRELQIPCVVGTNIATKVLKDGDLVEVDANKGSIRKI